MKTGFNLLLTPPSKELDCDVDGVQAATMVWVADVLLLSTMYAAEAGDELPCDVIPRCMRYMCMRGIIIDRNTWPAIVKCKQLISEGGCNEASGLFGVVSQCAMDDDCTLVADVTCTSTSVRSLIDNANAQYHTWIPSGALSQVLKDATDGLCEVMQL